MGLLDRFAIPKAAPLRCGGLVVASSWLSGGGLVRCTAGCDHPRAEAEAGAPPNPVKVAFVKVMLASWAWAIFAQCALAFGSPAHGGSGGQTSLFGTDLGVWHVGAWALSGWELIAAVGWLEAVGVAVVAANLPNHLDGRRGPASR
ncbi:MAG: hypothetical protein HY553_21855 [Elusimicrobia bacterium]|nr:hypothetical protein [Elusimicrobiota bacterium]